jgi:excisionase family DNA binding protein
MPENSTNEMFLTLPQAAEKLQVSVQTMGRYVRSGRVRAVKLGRDWRVPTKSLQDLADSASRSVASTSTGAPRLRKAPRKAP